MNHWRRLSELFAALAVREQALIAVAGVVIAITLCDFLFWSPLGTATKALQNQRNQLQQQYQSLRLQHLDISAQLIQDPDQPVRQQLQAAHARIDAQDRRVQELTAGLVRPDTMSKVLRDLLDQRKGLKLLALANEPAVLAFAKLHKSSDPQTKTGLVPVYKHGLTLTLKGSYFDVLDYLHAVEESPWHFFWERLEYRVGHYPEAEVTLRVYTLGDHEELIGA